MGELFEKSSPTPPQKLSNSNYQNRFIVYKRTDGARINLAFATANGKVAKRRGGNEKHHSVVFEPHRDRAAARPTETLLTKKVE